jgi:hypothetical protein
VANQVDQLGPGQQIPELGNSNESNCDNISGSQIVTIGWRDEHVKLAPIFVQD